MSHGETEIQSAQASPFQTDGAFYQEMKGAEHEYVAKVCAGYWRGNAVFA